MTPDRRRGPGFPAPPDWPDDSEICPGYLVQMPAVGEAARARLHWEKGHLRERYEGLKLTGLLLDCIEVLNGAVGEVEASMFKKN